MSVTDEIKARIDIVSYVQRYVPSLKKSGRNYKACCPFHNEKTPSFIVNPERGTWHCFGACAEGGDIFTFAQKVNGWDFKETLRELAQQAGVELKSEATRQSLPQDWSWSLAESEPQVVPPEENQTQLDILAEVAERYHSFLYLPQGAETLAYVREQRGINDDTIRKFKIGLAPNRWDGALRKLRQLGYEEDDIVEAGVVVRNDKGKVYDRFRNRLMIPIRDEIGRVVGFGARALDPDDKAKYINSPQSAIFNKSSLLYGLDMAKEAISSTGKAVLVEGYLDVIQAHQAGFCNVVAQMGTAMTEEQVALLTPKYTRLIWLALDTDAAGKAATDRGNNIVQNIARPNNVRIHFFNLPEGKDADDVIRDSPQQWRRLFEKAEMKPSETERHCLRLLLRNHELFYQINREFRLLAGGDEALQKGPLREFGADDFFQEKYRRLMAHFLESLAQHDMEPLEHLKMALDSECLSDLEALLVEDREELSMSINRNFMSDFDDIVSRRARKRGPASSERDEAVHCALRMRRAGLQHRRIEALFWQEQAHKEQKPNLQLDKEVQLSVLAKARIDLAVGEQRPFASGPEFQQQEPARWI